MNTPLISVLASALLVLPTASAVGQGSPVADAVRHAADRAERNLVAAAQSMPANKYGFKPTPQQMSFAQLMLHVAGSNEYMCSTISGTKAPDEPKLAPTASKDEIVQRLQRSFAYCHTALGQANDTALGDSVPFFGGRKITRGGALVDLAADWADHYGAAAIYLRLNGILPPTARRQAAEG